METALELRPYQQRAVSAIAPLIGKEEKILISMPTGTGRTITVMSALREYYKLHHGRTLFVVDRKASKDQLKSVALQVLKDYCVVSTPSNGAYSNLVCIETLQWLNKHYREIGPYFFTIIIYIDYESMGFSWQDEKPVKMLDSLKPVTNIGVGYNISRPNSFFGEVTFRYSIENAIEDGALRGFKTETIRIGGKEHDFYTFDETGLVLKAESAFPTISNYLLQELDDKKSIVLVSSQRNAVMLSELVNRQSGKENSFPLVTTNDTLSQREAISRFQEGVKLNMLIGTNLLSNGIDLGDIDCLVLLRNFRDKETLVNAISEFLRIRKKITSLRILNFVGVEGIDSDDIFFIQPVIQKIPVLPETPDQVILRKKQSKFYRTEVNYTDRNHVEGVLGVKDIAEELSDIMLKMPCEHGGMIGIFGQWGRGKTFLMNETWKAIERRRQNVVRIDFQAWKYQDTPAIWAYLYEKFAEKYHGASGWWIRFCRRIRLNCVREGYGSLVWFGILFAVSIILGFLIPPETKLRWIWKAVTLVDIFLLLKIIFFSLRYRKSAIALFRKYYAKISFANMLGVQAEVQKELRWLVRAWVKGKGQKKLKIVLFVDDIDRCSEEKIVRIIDSLRVMLDDAALSERIVIVAAIDERILRMAIRHKYTELLKREDQDGNKQLVSEYIDKLFLIGLKLGPLTSDETDEYFQAFVRQDLEQGDELLAENSLREAPSTPDTSGGYAGSLSEAEEENPADTTSEPDPEEAEGDEPEEIPAETSGGERPPIPEKLSAEEVQVLREALQASVRKTPRQVRVFYYRYIIAKHLLIKIAPENIWTHSARLEDFVKLLLKLGDSPDQAQAIDQEKAAVEKITGENYKMALLDDKEVPAREYKILLNVLDLVIGY